MRTISIIERSIEEFKRMNSAHGDAQGYACPARLCLGAVCLSDKRLRFLLRHQRTWQLVPALSGMLPALQLNYIATMNSVQLISGEKSSTTLSGHDNT